MDTLVASLVDINLSPIFDPLRIKETPDQAIYQAYEETGTDLAQVRIVASISASPFYADCWEVHIATARCADISLSTVGCIWQQAKCKIPEQGHQQPSPHEMSLPAGC